MANAQRIVDIKGHELAWLPPTATALEAAQLMNDRHIGSVVVILDDQLVGIFTERDVMKRVVAEGLDPASTRLYDVMTSPVAVAAPHTTLDELRKAMREKHIRHFPVVDGDEVTGMVSIGDLNRAQHDVDLLTIRYLEQYMSI